MRKLVWIILIAIIGFLIAYGVFKEVKAPVDAFVNDVGGQTALVLGSWWTGVATNPLYIQYHMLVWFAGGIVFLFALQRVWNKRPSFLWNKQQVAQVAYQNQPVAQAPVVIQQPQSSAAPVSPNPVVEEPVKEATA